MRADNEREHDIWEGLTWPVVLAYFIGFVLLAMLAEWIYS
jgi:hypothetical protein